MKENKIQISKEFLKKQADIQNNKNKDIVIYDVLTKRVLFNGSAEKLESIENIKLITNLIEINRLDYLSNIKMVFPKLEWNGLEMMELAKEQGFL